MSLRIRETVLLDLSVVSLIHNEDGFLLTLFELQLVLGHSVGVEGGMNLDLHVPPLV